MVVGISDSGKTTLTAIVAGALAARGERVAVVDADLGQSEIGPPTTVGLGRVAGPLVRLGDAELLALEFVGTTSPARAVRETARATGTLVDRARAEEFDRILVDTSGLVAGPFGRWLKRLKVEQVRPDLLIVIERGDERDALAHDVARPGLRVLRVPAATGVRRRRQDERRRHRTSALGAYFAHATVVRLAVSALTVRRLDEPGAPGIGPADTDLLVGLENRAAQTCGVGRILSVDASGQTLEIATPLAPDAIAGVTLGRERYGG
jgi:polynucleotide 5'-hydroxyl-kinase GRC3/NOL9